MEAFSRWLDDVSAHPLAQAILLLAIVCIRVIVETRKMTRPKPHKHPRKGGTNA